MRLLLFSVALLTLTVGQTTYASDDAAFEAALARQYRSLEPELRSMIDNQVRLLDQATKERVEKGIIPPASEYKRTQAIGGLKTMAYNKAINQMRCVIDLKNSPPKSPDLLERKFKACVEDRQAELVKSSKLSDYISAIGLQRASVCEMRARDFDSERRFPPFDFLRIEGGTPAFDFKVMNECILSSR